MSHAWALLFVAACTKPTAPAGSDAAAPALADAAPSHADAASDGAPTLVDDAPPAASPSASFGEPREFAGGICSYLLKGTFRLAEKDLRTSFVDGDDLLALVNRSPTGALAPDYAPSDLLSFSPRKARTARECESVQCLRKDAMTGYDALVAAMKTAGFSASLESAYRSYHSQCGTFAHWASTSSACRASQQSALPGHSQHQLGTVVDLFTDAWRLGGPGVFRHGFGCNAAGAFLREQAWKYGWIVSYPIHPDDRVPKQPCEPRYDVPVGINPATGYGHEAWHLRFLGVEHATQLHEAAAHDETLTLEQWLRSARGLPGAPVTELPVCDGCNCGACASLDPDASACKDALPALPTDRAHQDEHEPSLIGATLVRLGEQWIVKVQVHVPAGVTTQPPLFRAGKPGYGAGEDFTHIATLPGGGARLFATLPGGYRLAARPATIPGAASTQPSWPYRIALPVAVSATVYDRANVVLPAVTGDGTVMLAVPETVVEVAMLHGDEPVARLPLTPP